MRRYAAIGCLALGLACGPTAAPPAGASASGDSSSSAPGSTAADDASETSGPPPTTTTTSTTSTATSSTTSGADTGSSGSSGPPPMTDQCDGDIVECNDGMDNDGDGLVDLADPECLSPCDNVEGRVGSTFVGDNIDCVVDCAFDSNFGSGDDDCLADLGCDPLSPGADLQCDFLPPPMCPGPASAECLAYCLPRTPNGCDCFGCCAFDLGGVPAFLYAGTHSLCDLDDLAATCNACTPDMSCFDACDQPCEVCVGSTTPPPGCMTPDCDAREQPCTIDAQGQHDCPDGFYCVTGCCHPEI